METKNRLSLLLMLPSNFNNRFEKELALRYEAESSLLHEAILYSLLGPGKRLRPKLAFLSAQTVNQDLGEEEVFTKTLPSMLAVEMVHCYSLVHDDLPAMDDDDYRRGRLSCHKKYGEAVGILVGDALIADAFHVLSTAQREPLSQVRELASAIGSSGMVLGQYDDLNSTHADWAKWQNIHALKTGRLFECACVLGALSAGASDGEVNLVREYAQSFGVAFQLKDDLGDDALTVALLGRNEVERLLKERVEQSIIVSQKLKSESLYKVALQLLE